jgi:ribose 5-phosphate isomerase B
VTVIIDCDNIAIDLKNIVVNHLIKREIDVKDLDYSRDHPNAFYPEIGFNLAQKIKNKEYERGILICGTGLGMAMIANKVETVYAGVCHDVYSAERLRKSNNAQIITMGSRVIGPELAKTIIDAWLKSEFEGGGSEPKVAQMRSLERNAFHPDKK